MFWYKILFDEDAKKMKKLDIKLCASQSEVISLKSTVKNLEAEVVELKNERHRIIAECSFEIDFKNFKVFSIERTVAHLDKSDKFRQETTVLGHIVEGKINEWVFHCSRETHEKLVRKFQDYLKSENKA